VKNHKIGIFIEKNKTILSGDTLLSDMYAQYCRWCAEWDIDPSKKKVHTLNYFLQSIYTVIIPKKSLAVFSKKNVFWGERHFIKHINKKFVVKSLYISNYIQITGTFLNTPVLRFSGEDYEKIIKL